MTSSAPAPCHPPRPAGDAAPVIEVADLVKVYGTGDNAVTALRGVSFAIRQGEFVSIMGQSGSGKSTLLHVLACLHRPTGGRYLFEGRAIEELDDRELSALRGRRIGMVFQRFNLLPAENIMVNAELPLVYARVAPAERRRRSTAALSAMGLGERLEHLPTQLSGGQLQRAAIARALVADPAVILADEPTGNLDSESGRLVMGIFRSLHRMGRTVIQVTHDREKAIYADRILHIKDGRLDREETVENPVQEMAAGIDLSYLAHEADGEDDGA
ncbi:MAG TPA: ABC transporter ATP-binding protein [Planctomycetota bacterium]|nr:ABC transporter ATP-binding protein [Planctomycetota bacterium]